MKRLLVLVGLIAIALAAWSPGASPSSAATPPGGQVTDKVLTCFNVSPKQSGVVNHVVNLNDIYAVANHALQAWPSPGYLPLYDLTGAAPAVNLSDIFAIAPQFATTCPAKETQIALAAKAAEPYVTLNETLLSQNGYVRSTGNVPGQGVHYSRINSPFNIVFDPEVPQGMVYSGTRLVALFYVMWGGGGGIGFFGQVGDVEKENIDIPSPCSGSCGPPLCTGALYGCSFSGGEDLWHAHAGLCAFGIGTPNSGAASGTTQAECTAQAQPSLWFETFGWMNHLWAFKRNPNGRFADCEPPYGYSDCPD